MMSYLCNNYYFQWYSQPCSCSYSTYSEKFVKKLFRSNSWNKTVMVSSWLLFLNTSVLILLVYWWQIYGNRLKYVASLPTLLTSYLYRIFWKAQALIFRLVSMWVLNRDELVSQKKLELTTIHKMAKFVRPPIKIKIGLWMITKSNTFSREIIQIDNSHYVF